jgi:hypothetical protein
MATVMIAEMKTFNVLHGLFPKAEVIHFILIHGMYGSNVEIGETPT